MTKKDGFELTESFDISYKAVTYGDQANGYRAYILQDNLKIDVFGVYETPDEARLEAVKKYEHFVRRELYLMVKKLIPMMI